MYKINEIYFLPIMQDVYMKEEDIRIMIEEYKTIMSQYCEKLMRANYGNMKEYEIYYSNRRTTNNNIYFGFDVIFANDDVIMNIFSELKYNTQNNTISCSFYPRLHKNKYHKPSSNWFYVKRHGGAKFIDDVDGKYMLPFFPEFTLSNPSAAADAMCGLKNAVDDI